MRFLHSSIYIITLFLFLSISYAGEVALTIDDPNCGNAVFLSHQERDQKILSTLKKFHLQAILFVSGRCIDSPQGKVLLSHWNDESMLLGNHTYSHKSINDVTEAEYQSDTLKNEKLLKIYSHYKKLFRFPYLKEGNTINSRDSFRRFLSENHYEMGSVTIDASDWYISHRLEIRLSQNPKADITLYKKYYLEHIWDRAQYYDRLAKTVIGRSPKHTLLIHHNLLNALFLDDLIQMFQEKGWKVINAEEAFQDPIFQKKPNTIPAGESLIWALAKEKNPGDEHLRYPGEDETYEKEAMDKLGL